MRPRFPATVTVEKVVSNVSVVITPHDPQGLRVRPADFKKIFQVVVMS